MDTNINLTDYILERVYSKGEIYTQTQINSLLEQYRLEGGELLEVVDTLPVTNIKNNRLYLVYNNDNDTGNLFDVYFYVDGEWEQLDSLSFNINDYPTKNQLDLLLLSKADVDNVNTILNNLNLTKDNLTSLYDNLTAFNSVLISFDDDNTNLSDDLVKLKDNLSIFLNRMKLLIDEFNTLDQSSSDLSDELDNLNGQFDNLEGIVNQLGGESESLRSDLDGFTDDLADFRTELDGAKSDFSDLNDDFSTFTVETNTLLEGLEESKVSLSAFNSQVESFQTALSGLSSADTALSSRLDSFRDNDLAGFQSSLNGLLGRVGAVETANTELLQGLREFDELINGSDDPDDNGLSGDLSGLKSDFDDFTVATNNSLSTLNSTKVSLTAFQSKISELETANQNLINQNNALTESLEKFKNEDLAGFQLCLESFRDNDIQELNTKFTTLETQLYGVDGDLTKLLDGFTDLDGDLLVSASDFADLQTKLVNFINDLSSLGGILTNFEGGLNALKTELASKGIDLNTDEIGDSFLQLFASIGLVKEDINTLNRETLPKVQEDINNVHIDLYGDGSHVFNLVEDTFSECIIDVSDLTGLNDFNFMVSAPSVITINSISFDTETIDIRSADWKYDTNVASVSGGKITINNASTDSLVYVRSKEKVDLTDINTIKVNAKSDNSNGFVVVFVGDESNSKTGVVDNIRIAKENIATVQHSISEAELQLESAFNHIGNVNTPGTILGNIESIKNQIGSETTTGTILYDIKTTTDALISTNNELAETNACIDVVKGRIDESINSINLIDSVLDGASGHRFVLTTDYKEYSINTANISSGNGVLKFICDSSCIIDLKDISYLVDDDSENLISNIDFSDGFTDWNRNDSENITLDEDIITFNGTTIELDLTHTGIDFSHITSVKFYAKSDTDDVVFNVIAGDEADAGLMSRLRRANTRIGLVQESIISLENLLSTSYVTTNSLISYIGEEGTTDTDTIRGQINYLESVIGDENDSANSDTIYGLIANVTNNIATVNNGISGLEGSIGEATAKINQSIKDIENVNKVLDGNNSYRKIIGTASETYTINTEDIAVVDGVLKFICDTPSSIQISDISYLPSDETDLISNIDFTDGLTDWTVKSDNTPSTNNGSITLTNNSSYMSLCHDDIDFTDIDSVSFSVVSSVDDNVLTVIVGEDDDTGLLNHLRRSLNRIDSLDGKITSLETVIGDNHSGLIQKTSQFEQDLISLNTLLYGSDSNGVPYDSSHAQEGSLYKNVAKAQVDIGDLTGQISTANSTWATVRKLLYGDNPTTDSNGNLVPEANADCIINNVNKTLGDIGTVQGDIGDIQADLYIGKTGDTGYPGTVTDPAENTALWKIKNSNTIIDGLTTQITGAIRLLDSIYNGSNGILDNLVTTIGDNNTGLVHQVNEMLTGVASLEVELYGQDTNGNIGTQASPYEGSIWYRVKQIYNSETGTGLLPDIEKVLYKGDDGTGTPTDASEGTVIDRVDSVEDKSNEISEVIGVDDIEILDNVGEDTDNGIAIMEDFIEEVAPHVTSVVESIAKLDLSKYKSNAYLMRWTYAGSDNTGTPTNPANGTIAKTAQTANATANTAKATAQTANNTAQIANNTANTLKNTTIPSITNDDNTGTLDLLQSDVGDVKTIGGGNLQNQIASLLEVMGGMKCQVVETIDDMYRLNTLYTKFCYVKENGKYYKFNPYSDNGNCYVKYYDANGNEVNPTGDEILLSAKSIANARELGDSKLWR